MYSQHKRLTLTQTHSGGLCDQEICVGIGMGLESDLLLITFCTTRNSSIALIGVVLLDICFLFTLQNIGGLFFGRSE